VRSRHAFLCGMALIFALMASVAHAGEPAEVLKGLLAGNYAAVIKQSRSELQDAPANSEWSILLVQALLATGRYADADVAMKEALTREPRNIRLRWLAREVAFANGRPDEAAKRVDEIRLAVRDGGWQ
jgi:hypothetical protein